MIGARIFRTRSFSKQPVGTIKRGLEWVIRSKLQTPTTFSVDFGSHRFAMKLQATKRKFGSAGIFVQRKYYEPLLEFGDKLISKNDNVIDGGANQGIFSCAFAAQVGPAGMVYAFEPQTYAIKCLMENARLNNFKNIAVFNGALSDVGGEAYLDIGKGPVSASITNLQTAESNLLVKTFSISELLLNQSIRPVQFIKLDVEGAELKALNGAEAALNTANRPAICIEAFEVGLYQNIVAFLRHFGYKPYYFNEQGKFLRFERFLPSANVFFMPR